MTLKVYAPYNQALIKELPLDTEEKVERSLEKAYALFIDNASGMPPYKRVAILENLLVLMNDRVEELTKVAAQEGGKPYADSKVEVLRAINGVKLAIEGISHLNGTQIPMGLTASNQNRWAFSMREPIGVVVSLSAFNHPINLIVHQTVTAIAAGCPVIVKPAPTTPLSCLKFVELLKEAGLEEGWCQAIICNNELAEKLATDKRVNYLSFIGSSRVGWYLRSKLAAGTRCGLEHGGAAPVIIERDADFSSMIPLLVKGGFYHAGQVCVSVQRIFVHTSIAERLRDEMVKKVRDLKVGDPLDTKTEVGPLITPKEVDRVDSWVKEAIAEGASLACGGQKISDTCYAPTILYDVPDDSKVSRNEIFGPVVCIYPFEDRGEAIKKANALDVHFQASVFTKDIDVAMGTVKKLNATAVMVNDHTAFRVDWMPFGGRDSSGLGMGGIAYSMQEMTREKMMVIKSDSI